MPPHDATTCQEIIELRQKKPNRSVPTQNESNKVRPRDISTHQKGCSVDKSGGFFYLEKTFGRCHGDIYFSVIYCSGIFGRVQTVSKQIFYCAHCVSCCPTNIPLNLSPLFFFLHSMVNKYNGRKKDESIENFGLKSDTTEILCSIEGDGHVFSSP